MAKYRFQIDNYHAIKHADLEINGITVVAGVNGCGKSTMSRWLYYVVNGLASLDDLLFSDFRDSIVNSLCKLSVAVDDVSAYSEGDKKKSYEDMIALLSMITLSNGGVEKLRKCFVMAMDLLSEMLRVFMLQESNANQVLRVLNVLGIDGTDNALQKLHENAMSLFAKSEADYQNRKSERPLTYLQEKVKYVYKEKDSFPKVMCLKEDEVELLSEKMGKVYGLNGAIYMGTPTAISLRQSDQVMLKSLADKILYSNDKASISSDSSAILSLIERMLGGIVMEKENLSSVDLVLHSKLGQEVRIEDLASGYKPLVYLLRLISNGWLTENTLLEIDEPETNLHPQWVVEFAHLLIMIHKYLGTKILITSHHPDMVSAIRYISEKEGLLDVTRFYLAEPVDEVPLYEYKNLGNDIDPVFESFNESFATIQKYADNYGEL